MCAQYHGLHTLGHHRKANARRMSGIRRTLNIGTGDGDGDLCDDLEMSSTPSLPPRADLHRHLDGSLREATLRELAEPLGVTVPEDIYFHPGMGLDAALECFDLTLSVLQSPEAVRRVASEICEDAAADGIETLEIRFAPQLHRGAPLQGIIEAAVEGAAGRAGIILCTLYGNDPTLALELAECGGRTAGVVGLDLAGGPAPVHRWGLKHYEKAFTRARKLGLGRTVHAGEGRPAAEIGMAIEVLHAQRIGHGTTLLDDPAVLDLVLRREVTIEACPTSNVQTSVIPSVSAHPLPRWLELGVKACICTDNTLLSQVSSTSEHLAASQIEGMSPQLLERAIRWGHRARFVR